MLHQDMLQLFHRNTIASAPSPYRIQLHYSWDSFEWTCGAFVGAYALFHVARWFFMLIDIFMRWCFPYSHETGGDIESDGGDPIPSLPGSWRAEFGLFEMMRRKRLANLRKNPPAVTYSSAGRWSCGACAICLESFRDGELCRLIPPCKHIFHDSCIETWFLEKNTCPVCRFKLPF